jgi:predicted alpha/beta hydrolase family esterase
MAHKEHYKSTNAGVTPLILTIPGLGNSGPQHWQSLWEREREDCHRVDLGDWDKPHRNNWVNKLNLAIIRADRPVVLVAHSLGCLAAAWWVKYEQPAATGPVIGALLVAPPEVDFFPIDERLTKFAPMPEEELPFPSILTASRNDPCMGFRTARRLARAWGSTFADAGDVGHINADSGIDDWPFGKFLLGRLLRNQQTHCDIAHNGIAAAGEVARFAHGREASPAIPPLQLSGSSQNRLVPTGRD